MKKRVKDLAYKLKINKSALTSICEELDVGEEKFYKKWDEPKTDKLNRPISIDGVLQTRPINAPIDRLKRIQKVLLNKVLYDLELPQYFYGGIKNKDGVLNVKHHQGNKYFFTTDFKNYYPSITYKTVYNALRKEGFYPDVSRIITRICTKNGVIPQGCPTSSFLASLVLKHSCSDLFEEYEKSGFRISIFIDDLTISNSIDFKDKTQKVLKDLRDRGLKINFDKTHYCYFASFTGVQIKNNGIEALPHTYELLKDASISKESQRGHKERIKYIQRVSNCKRSEISMIKKK